MMFDTLSILRIGYLLGKAGCEMPSTKEEVERLICQKFGFFPNKDDFPDQIVHKMIEVNKKKAYDEASKVAGF